MSQPAAQVALYSLRPALQNPGLTSMRKTYCSSHVRSSCEQYEALSQVSWQLIHGVERMVNDTAARAHRTEPQSLLRVLSPVLLPANARAREYLKSPRWKSPQDDRVEEYPESLERPGPRGAAVGPKHEHIATNTLLKTDEWAWLEDPILERFFLGNLQDPFWLDLILISPYFRQRLLDKRVERPFYIFLQQIAGTAPDGVVSALTLIHQAGASSEMELLLVASEHPITVGLPLKTFWWPQVIQPKLGDYQYSLFVRVLREWAQAELIEPAFELAKALLELHVEFPSKATGNELTRVRGKAPSYPYQQALDVMIDHLMPHEPMECLSLFAGLLHTLELELDAHEGIERFDALGYGRRAIEAHHQNTAMDLDDPLLDALRLTAESILEREVLPGAELVKQLSRYRGNLFIRLNLHLVERIQDDALTERFLLNRLYMSDTTFHHEFYRLILSGYSRLPLESQTVLLRWCEEDARETAHQVAQLREEVSNPSFLEQRFRYYHYRNLEPIHEHLLEQDRTLYDQYQEEFGPLTNPDFLVYSSSAMYIPGNQVTLPEGVEGAEALIQAVQAVDKVEEEDNPTPLLEMENPGSARSLSGYLSAKPEFYTPVLFKFHTLEPGALFEVLWGLRQGIERLQRSMPETGTFEWGETLQLLQWIVDTHRTDDAGIRDPLMKGWGSVRKQVTNLLGYMVQTPLALGPEHREAIWAVLEPLTHDPDPSPEQEAKDRTSFNQDPATQAINTVRGEVFHTLIRYALWVHFNLEAQQVPEPHLAHMSEVKVVLEQHLDLKVDRSLAIRSVYGQWFAWLMLLDKGWAEAVSVRIFDETEPELRDAAWSSFLRYGGAFNEPFEALRRVYQLAVLRLPGEGDEKSASDSDERLLAQQLMLFYIRGVLPLEDRLFEQFFQRASPVLRENAISFLGNLLSRDDWKPLDVAALERAFKLWDARLDAAEQNLEDSGWAEELGGFGRWLHLDADLWLVRLERQLGLGFPLDLDPIVLEALEHLLEHEPERVERVVFILERLVHLQAESTSPYSWYALKGLMEKLMAPGRLEPLVLRPLIEVLVARGELGYFGSWWDLQMRGRADASRH